MAAVEQWAGDRPLRMILDWQAGPGSVEFYQRIGYEPDYVGDFPTHPGFCLDQRAT